MNPSQPNTFCVVNFYVTYSICDADTKIDSKKLINRSSSKCNSYEEEVFKIIQQTYISLTESLINNTKKCFKLACWNFNTSLGFSDNLCQDAYIIFSKVQMILRKCSISVSCAVPPYQMKKKTLSIDTRPLDLFNSTIRTGK